MLFRSLEVYASQAMNHDAERKAIEIRLRAERRCGQLLKDMQRAASPNPDGKNQHVVTRNDGVQPKSEYRTALEQSNISPRTAQRYQQMADMPAQLRFAARSSSM